MKTSDEKLAEMAYYAFSVKAKESHAPFELLPRRQKSAWLAVAKALRKEFQNAGAPS